MKFAIIACILISSCKNENKLKDEAVLHSLESIIKNEEAWDEGFPKNSDELKSVLIKHGIITNWPKDPWGHPYRCDIILSNMKSMTVRLSGSEKAITFQVSRKSEKSQSIKN